MSFNDSFAGYLLFEIMMRVLNNKIEKMKKGVDKYWMLAYNSNKSYKTYRKGRNK